MSILISLAVALVVGLIGFRLGSDYGFTMGRASVEAAKAEAFKRGEQSARFHNRSFIRYEPYFRSTVDQLIGPTVEEPTS
jgi:hypothetical protein